MAANGDPAPQHTPTASVYTPKWFRRGGDDELPRYDRVVYGYSCRWYGWGPTARRMVRFYRDHLRPTHLDVGVGTGFLLDQLNPDPAELTTLYLLDANAEPLAATMQRLTRYTPTPVQADALDPWPDLPDNCADSAACSLTMHCLPDPDGRGIAAKTHLFREVARCLTPGGRFFGSTVIRAGLPTRLLRPAGTVLQWLYRRWGWFANRHDTAADLRTHLNQHFDDVTVWVEGHVALWTATARKEDRQ